MIDLIKRLDFNSYLFNNTKFEENMQDKYLHL